MTPHRPPPARLLPLSLAALAGFFYVAAFFPQPTAGRTALFAFLALCTAAGLRESAAAPAPLSPPTFHDPFLGALAALAVQLLARHAHASTVQAAALVGIAAWFTGKTALSRARHLQPAVIYCGAFAGMSSPLVLPGLLPGLLWIALAGALAGLFYSLTHQVWGGIGGKLGTLAFAASALTTAFARANPAPLVPLNPAVQPLVVLTAILAVPATHALAGHRSFGAVGASALPSALLAFLLPPPLASAWFGASFAGMISGHHLRGGYWKLPLMGLLYATLSLGFGPRLNGIGGGLGTTAALAVFATLGLHRLLSAARQRSF